MTAAPAAPKQKVTVEELTELVDYTPLPGGQVKATLIPAPGQKIEHIADDQDTAETVMLAHCCRLARYLNAQ